jgi:GNAT superfamily N-acetyltransferase
MAGLLRVERIETLPPDLAELELSSLRENFRAVERLRADWESGENRFTRPGEALFEGRCGQRLVAMGGLNRDPYAECETVGRLRHLYVVPELRRRGVGKAMVAAILEHARRSFGAVRLRTDRAEADSFYVALGFARTPGEEAATHILRLASFET